jgi:hypothetical protein
MNTFEAHACHPLAQTLIIWSNGVFFDHILAQLGRFGSAKNSNPLTIRDL